MPDPRQLASLIKLIDDETPEVRDAVFRELSAFGAGLTGELASQNIELTEGQHRFIQNLIGDHARRSLMERWPSWFKIPDDKEKLERAFSFIADFQHGDGYPLTLATQLDALAAEYRTIHPEPHIHTLADFLFREKKLRGATENYYSPKNSNLVHVIEQQQGIPISLVCIYMLVGKRLGLTIEGCNYPGHFLACAYDGPEPFIVDCFGGGKFVTQRDIMQLNTANTPETGAGGNISLDDIISLQCNAETIVSRVLRNLINAYQMERDQTNVRLMADLLDMCEIYGKDGEDEQRNE